MAAASTAGTPSKTVAPNGLVPTTKFGNHVARHRNHQRQPDRQPDHGENGALIEHHAHHAAGVAPIARRIPTFVRLRVTAQATTPYSPITAMSKSDHPGRRDDLSDQARSQHRAIVKERAMVPTWKIRISGSIARTRVVPEAPTLTWRPCARTGRQRFGLGELMVRH